MSKLLQSLAFLCVLSSMCLSCAGDLTIEKDETGSQPESLQDLLPAPSLLDDSRDASELLPYIRLGNDVYKKSPGSSFDGDALDLPAVSPGANWGMWRFNPDRWEAREIEVDFSSNAGGAVLLAVPDYPSGRWQFHGPSSLSFKIDIDESSSFTNGGYLYVAVISTGSEAVSVEKLTLVRERPDWSIVTLASGGHSQRYPCLAEVQGGPAVAYTHLVTGADQQLMYAHATDQLGDDVSDWKHVVVDDSGQSKYSSLKIVNGNPAICYAETVSDELRYVRSTSVLGNLPAHWDDKVVIQTDAGIGYPDMEVVDGEPAVVFVVSGPSKALRYAWSDTVNGTNSSDWTVFQLDVTTEFFFSPDLAIIADHPAIAYYDSGNGEILYIRSWTKDGREQFDWLQFATIDDTDVASPVSLMTVDGYPVVTYAHTIGYAVNYARCSNVTGGVTADWDQLMMLETDINRRCSNICLGIYNGLPLVAYSETNYEELIVRFSPNASGIGHDEEDWFADLVFKSDELDLLDVDMAIVNGNICLSWYDSGLKELKFAVLPAL